MASLKRIARNIRDHIPVLQARQSNEVPFAEPIDRLVRTPQASGVPSRASGAPGGVSTSSELPLPPSPIHPGTPAVSRGISPKPPVPPSMPSCIVGDKEMPLVQLLGQGQHGQVYLSFDGERRCVLKLISTVNADAASVIARERAMCEKEQEVPLPFLVRSYACGPSSEVSGGDVWAITMQYLPGGSFDDYLKKSGPMGEADARTWLFKAARALESMHQVAIHRDIKPANFMLDENGDLYLGDFGTVVLDGQPMGEMMGTPAYLPLEQEGTTRKSDIWSLGAVFYEMLTGRLPVESAAPYPTAPYFYNPALQIERPANISDGTWELLQRMLDRNPANRPTAVEVRQLALPQ